MATDVEAPDLSGTGKFAALGLALTAVTLLAASGWDLQLGLPTAICGLVTAVAVLIRKRVAPWAMLKDISWGVLPLVAGPFMLVEALDRTGLTRSLGGLLHAAAARGEAEAAWTAGLAVAFGCNLLNNLPAGLMAGSAVESAQVSDRITSAVLVGVDLGPNLSVTGSLANILWLSALRREGITVSALRFLRLGLLVMPPALVLALAGLFVHA